MLELIVLFTIFPQRNSCTMYITQQLKCLLLRSHVNFREIVKIVLPLKEIGWNEVSIKPRSGNNFESDFNKLRAVSEILISQQQRAALPRLLY